ncbi:hypothetical protein PoB_003336400 [Plakobranchus ocellatus]|uniref:Sema domain-containing protein n=1 Tax=Plakobranchus ocellatus TaxID=259542 RepID=A0AAV4AGQ6_9GAST|nr:hypothetical protein PoB_003336400 [Plakobranchus ocellatus]
MLCPLSAIRRKDRNMFASVLMIPPSSIPQVVVQGRSRLLCGTFNATSSQAKYICGLDSFPSLHRRHSAVEDQTSLRRAACVSRLHKKKICVALLMS